uniref:Uncharacterized protein n=1 Tax=Rhizophora mucronata TaxID=61149 RepID=A0A2P2NMN0_RHIMU
MFIPSYSFFATFLAYCQQGVTIYINTRDLKPDGQEIVPSPVNPLKVWLMLYAFWWNVNVTHLQ